MIIDKKLLFTPTTGTALSATATASAVSDVLDFGSASRDVGSGDDLACVIRVQSSFAGSSATSIAFSLQDSADNSTFTDVLATPTIAKASLIAGYQVIIPLKPGLRRYVRVKLTATGTDSMTGTFFACVTDNYTYQVAMPDGLPSPATNQ